MRTLGFIGLGMMGSAMALRAVQMGMIVYGYNRTREKVQHLKDRIRLVSSISELCEKSEAIIIMVSDDQADEDVTVGNRGLFESVKSGKIVIDSSTISPSLSKRLTEKLRRKGAIRIEMPVMGGPQDALRGELVAIVGAERTRYEELLKLIRIFATRIFYAGNIGSALTIKLALNFITAAYAEAIAEGISFVRRSGSDPLLLVQILNTTKYKTPFSQTKGIKMVQGSFEPTFYLRHMVKDLSIAEKTAQENMAFTPVLSVLKEVYKGAHNLGLGELDYSAVAEFLAKLNPSKR